MCMLGVTSTVSWLLGHVSLKQSLRQGFWGKTTPPVDHHHQNKAGEFQKLSKKVLALFHEDSGDCHPLRLGLGGGEWQLHFMQQLTATKQWVNQTAEGDSKA